MSEEGLTAVIPNCVIAYAIASHISLRKFIPTKGAAHTQRISGVIRKCLRQLDVQNDYHLLIGPLKAEWVLYQIAPFFKSLMCSF